jgi:glycosyltransferase involved in cell wall biosynthesis
MTIGIVIPTYYRKDNSTLKYLQRALNSIKNQTYTNYKVFLIGDKYENEEELITISSSIISKEKIFSINLPYAKERNKYPLGDKKLWCSGGVNATNYGIELCLKENINFICHLDHDDWWESNHLEEISKCINDYFFITTKSNHINNQILPKEKNIPFYPKSGDIIRSATCINFSKTNLRYRDVFEEIGKVYPADADLWNRISDFMKNTKNKGIVIDKVTCNHITERI